MHNRYGRENGECKVCCIQTRWDELETSSVKTEQASTRGEVTLELLDRGESQNARTLVLERSLEVC